MTPTSSTRKPARKLDVDELFAALEDDELTAAEIAYRFAVSRAYAATTLSRLASNGELLWTWDRERSGRGRPARRYRPSYVRAHEPAPRVRRPTDKPVSDSSRAQVIQALHRHGELTMRALAFETSLSDGHVSVVLAHLHAEGQVAYRRELRTGPGQRKRIYRLTLHGLRKRQTPLSF